MSRTMPEVLKSMMSLSYATSLLATQQTIRLVTSLGTHLESKRPAPATTSAPPDPTMPSPPPSTHPEAGAPMPAKIDSGRLDVSSFVVLGEGLAAGMGDFTLSEDMQNYSFPVQLARQMGAPFVQPLVEAPGIGEAPGFEPWSVIVPSALQSVVLNQVLEERNHNLSVPGLMVSDSIRLRPQQPLINRASAKQTLVNLILGTRTLAQGLTGTLATQLETAVSLHPTFAIVALGYAEALTAATRANPDELPAPASFREDYSTIVEKMRSDGADVLLLTVPDPFTTAHFSTTDAAAAITKLDRELLLDLWKLSPDDLITVKGLSEISFQVYAASIGPSSGADIRPLPAGSTLAAQVATRISAGVESLNQEIRQVAALHGARLFDLHHLLKSVRETGITVQGRLLTSDYLGGFYSLNGYYPGAAGQALIANQILQLLNQEFHASFPLIDLATILAVDPVAGYKRAQGPNWTRQSLSNPTALPLPMNPSTKPPASSSMPPAEPSNNSVVQPASHILKLPPGLEQVLPIDSDCSYFGDALTAQNCRTPESIKWGSGNNLFFGGLAIMDSHLSGNIRLKFTPPVGDWTTFEISFEKGLVGTNSCLAAPTFFKMPGRQQLVADVPGKISSGRLNLATGEVDPTPGSLNVYVSFFNSALFALLRVNPNFPTQPLSFPGQYGSARVTFDQRSDGKLDFTLLGSTFVPLGAGTSFPLNFCGPSRQFASIPANGTGLHPRIAITTKIRPQPKESADAPDIPFNTVQEYTLYSAPSSFGDLFTLNTPEMGGPALGRSRLYGRVQIQFGPRSGNSVPVAVSTTGAGGMLAPMSRTPLAQLFPGKLTPGPEGFYENLRFPMRTYSLNDLSVIDDPFDLSVGALDLRTGELIHPLLQRGFINQDLIFALLRVEPRTPQSSFFFEGPGRLKKGRQGEQVFQFFGSVHIPYPPRFLFPDPNLATGAPVVDGGSLDPYLWIWSIKSNGMIATSKSINIDHDMSSRGESYSYRLLVERDGRTEFEYHNHSQQGAFRMSNLVWIDIANSNVENDDLELITLTCFGTWSKNGVDRVVQAAVQVASAASVSYVGIQIGPGGEISNVNTLWPPTAFPLPFQAIAGKRV